MAFSLAVVCQIYFPYLPATSADFILYPANLLIRNARFNLP